ncbi:hypothetical protein GCM10027299_23810 [Larkinella ripae]
MNTAADFTNAADYAVIIGVRHYPEFGNLNGPTEDARAFYDWLTDPQKGSVPPANCQLVESNLDPDDEFPERPIQAQIDRAFQRIWQHLIGSGKPGRRFYFYFNGHGIGVKESNTALLMANFETRFFRDSALSSQGYLDRIIASGRFLEVVFLLDCCRNQVLGVNGLPPSFNWPADNKGAGGTAIWVGYATEYQNKAYEAEFELKPGEQDGSLFRGHFTQALLNGLNGEAAEPDTGRITPESLKRHLELETPRIASQKNHNQRARVTNNFPTDPSTFFGVKAFPKPVTTAQYRIEVSASRTGNVVLLDGDTQTLRSKDQDPLPWEVDLSTGLYMLVDEATQEEKPIRVKIPVPTTTIQLTF